MTFLTGMETSGSLECFYDPDDVYDLPNRDGNIRVGEYSALPQSVYDLPNRDGNSSTGTATRRASPVYDLPNRDGNRELNAGTVVPAVFMTFLTGMETRIVPSTGSMSKGL